ncbi:major pollen allergen Lol p 11-like [Diospyros lotus]|uniref:major pollen allergen Lol p 11-like n=1 Tax=Diospyros lotus TaxID=55363 RepID=UPI00224CE645|nr:major pollen allergen Lol p 11-like [Diospyros lotus]
MARNEMIMLAVAMCVMSATVVSATRPVVNPFVLQGRVYCDTCRTGFETPATTPISGAEVKLECRDRITQEVKHTDYGTTDSTGTYKILVKEDHQDELCDCMLVSSPQNDCATADPGRDRALVILTSNNGMASKDRFANALGFMRDEPLSECKQVLQQYELVSEED